MDLYVARIGFDSDRSRIDEDAPFEAESIAEGEEEDRARRHEKTSEKDPKERIVYLMEGHR
jgi:hypothetical protein